MLAVRRTAIWLGGIVDVVASFDSRSSSTPAARTAQRRAAPITRRHAVGGFQVSTAGAAGFQGWRRGATSGSPPGATTWGTRRPVAASFHASSRHLGRCGQHLRQVAGRRGRSISWWFAFDGVGNTFRTQRRQGSAGRGGRVAPGHRPRRRHGAPISAAAAARSWRFISSTISAPLVERCPLRRALPGSTAAAVVADRQVAEVGASVPSVGIGASWPPASASAAQGRRFGSSAVPPGFVPARGRGCARSADRPTASAPGVAQRLRRTSSARACRHRARSTAQAPSHTHAGHRRTWHVPRRAAPAAGPAAQRARGGGRRRRPQPPVPRLATSSPPGPSAPIVQPQSTTPTRQQKETALVRPASQHSLRARARANRQPLGRPARARRQLHPAHSRVSR